LTHIRRWGEPELLFQVFLGGHVPSEIVGKVYLQTILFNGGRNDMDMFVLGITVAYYNKGLFPITHMFHVSFGKFKKVLVVQLFATGKIDSGMYIPFFRIVPIAEIVEDPSKKLRIGVRIRIGVLEAEYGVICLAQYIVQHSLHIVPI
tara:strand:- start:869 stop:1312 length:444 start_codon:yes stop_codon:yes gene_type:complete